MTLKQVFQIAQKTGKQPKEILEKLIDLKLAEEAKLKFN
jgi:hypothetical protein